VNETQALLKISHERTAAGKTLRRTIKRFVGFGIAILLFAILAIKIYVELQPSPPPPFRLPDRINPASSVASSVGTSEPQSAFVRRPLVHRGHQPMLSTPIKSSPQSAATAPRNI
jgi:hypothetical protein